MVNKRVQEMVMNEVLRMLGLCHYYINTQCLSLVVRSLN